MRYPVKSLLIASSVLLATTAFGDELKVQVSKQGMEYQDMERPRSGITMERVEQRFGAPQNIQGPVGEPPITTWNYPQYSVYFEHDRVIHTVLRPNQP